MRNSKLVYIEILLKLIGAGILITIDLRLALGLWLVGAFSVRDRWKGSWVESFIIAYNRIVK